MSFFLALQIAQAEVPQDLQLDLLPKTLAYDRNMAARVEDGFQILVLDSPDATDRARDLLDRRLGPLGSPFGKTPEITHAPVGQVASACDQAAPDLVIIAPGARIDAATVEALNGRNLVSMSFDPEHVKLGIVVGFALRESRPRILLNLPQAKQQQVEFSARLLGISEVIR